MLAWVLDDGWWSHAFSVTNEVKLGSVLAPMLLSMMFSAMLSDTFNKDESGIKVSYPMYGKLFSLKKPSLKWRESWYRNFFVWRWLSTQYTSWGWNATEYNWFCVAYANFGLVAITKKTEVPYQPTPHHTYVEPSVTENGENLKLWINSVTLNILSRDVHIDDKFDTFITRVSSVLERIWRKVWERRSCLPIWRPAEPLCWAHCWIPVKPRQCAITMPRNWITFI